MSFKPYQSRAGLPAAGLGGRINPAIADGGALGAVSDAVSGVADLMEERRREAERDEAAAYVSRTMGAARRGAYERLTAAQERAAGDADGFTPAMMEDIGGYFDGLIEEAPNELAREVLQERFDPLKTGIFEDALAFEAGAGRAQKIAGLDAGVNDYAAAAYADPEAFPEIMAGLETNIDDAEQTFLKPQAAAEYRPQARDRVAIAAMRGRIHEDPTGALAALTAQEDEPSDPIVGALSVEARAQLAGTARAEIRRQDQARTALRGGLGDELRGMLSVVKAGFDVDPETLRRARTRIEALGPDGADLRADLARLERFQHFQTEIRQWTPAELEAWIGSERARLAEGGAVPEDVQRLAIAGAQYDRAAGRFDGLEDRVDALVSVMEKGYAPPPEDIEAARAGIEALGDADLAERLLTAVERYGQRQAGEDLSPAQQAAAAAGAEADLRSEGGVTLADVERLEFAKDLQGEMAKALAKDPVGYGQRIGIVDAGVLDLSTFADDAPPATPDQAADDGESPVDRMKARRAEAEALAAKYGRSPVYLSEAEAGLWSNAFDQAGRARQLELLKAVHEGFGAAAPAVLGQIADDHPVLAHVGRLADGAEGVHTADQALTGLAMMTEDPEAKPADANAVPAFDEAAGEAFVRVPRLAATARMAASAIYLARGGRGGDAFDDALYAEALDAALGGDGEGRGGLGEVNGAKTVLPRGMTEHEVEAALEAMGETDWTARAFDATGAGQAPPRYGDGTVAPPEDLADAQLQPVGDGVYLIWLPAREAYLRGNGPNGYYALDLSGDAASRLPAPPARRSTAGPR